MNSNVPISLSQEIEHVRHYVAIERIRFPDMTVQFELHSEEFLLPPLTIQPLVENAIRHGLMGVESGGTLTVESSPGKGTKALIRIPREEIQV